MVTIEVNNQKLDVEDGITILTACKRAGINIPTLCHIEGLPPSGACRICIVELDGRGLVPSCSFPVAEGMKINTRSLRVIEARKTLVELLLADHPDDCLYCPRNGNCELQKLAQDLGVRQRLFKKHKVPTKLDVSSPAMTRDPDKCILCGKCVRVCEEIQGVSAIDFVRRGANSYIGTAFDEGLNLSSCIQCGQCILACPTAALTEQSHTARVLEAISNPEKTVVVQHAPAISVSLAEEFGLKPGTDVDGLMVTALRMLGANVVFDTSFTADLTIMEEASELMQRLTQGGALPMMTSCSPGWIKFVETFYPDMIPHLSTCKSPQQMMGALIKSRWAERNGIDPKSIFSVSIMPCVAKKFEAARPEMSQERLTDIDAVLTTRELAQLFKAQGIELTALTPSHADNPFGERTSAGKMFGATGGVMEAAIRTAHFLVTGKELGDLKVTAVRGLTGVREASVEVDGLTVNVAVAHGIQNAKTLIERIRNGSANYHFIEVMTCPGGCVGGGGQPFGTDVEKLKARAKALYAIDRDAPVRVSHDNIWVKKLYEDYLGEPLGEKSHHLLHTHYEPRVALT